MCERPFWEEVQETKVQLLSIPALPSLLVCRDNGWGSPTVLIPFLW